MSAKEERGTGAGGSVFNTAEEDDSKQKIKSNQNLFHSNYP